MDENLTSILSSRLFTSLHIARHSTISETPRSHDRQLNHSPLISGKGRDHPLDYPWTLVILICKLPDRTLLWLAPFRHRALSRKCRHLFSLFGVRSWLSTSSLGSVSSPESGGCASMHQSPIIIICWLDIGLSSDSGDWMWCGWWPCIRRMTSLSTSRNRVNCTSDYYRLWSGRKAGSALRYGRCIHSPQTRLTFHVSPLTQLFIFTFSSYRVNGSVQRFKVTHLTYIYLLTTYFSYPYRIVSYFSSLVQRSAF